jgi:hypothetical protein
MPSNPFQPLFGGKKDIGDHSRPTKKRKAKPQPQPQPKPQPQPQPQSAPQPLLHQIPITSLKQKAASSLGELALFIDKRKTLLIIIIIILILLAVAIVVKRQEQQRKNLKLMRRKLKRLMA